MNIRQKILVSLTLASAMTATAIQANTLPANGADSARCTSHTMIMTAAEDGCTNYCTRSAFVCAPAAWWTAGGLSIPSSEAKAPLVLAFHGKRKLIEGDVPPGLWQIIQASPEAGMFAAETNLHGAMPSAITVYFQGLPVKPNWTPDNTDSFRGWQVNSSKDLSINRDITFVNKFVSYLVNDSALQNHVDMEKIYAVGHSNGSRFVGVLWNHSSSSNPLQRSRLKAVAFVSAQAGDFPAISNTASVVGDNLFTKADKKTSVFMTMGLQDNLVLFPFQQPSIQQVEDLLGIDLAVTPNLAEDVRGSNGQVNLRVYKHNLPDGHGWPANHQNEVADFFEL